MTVAYMFQPVLAILKDIEYDCGYVYGLVLAIL